MSYVKTLDDIAKHNIQVIVSVAKSRGIVNPVSLAGMLAVISKESGFKPQFEKSYANTSADRLIAIFPSFFKNKSHTYINQIKKDEVKFFNLIYGGRYGNEYNEGYKYRGGGLNQLTFKNNYINATKRINEFYGKVEIDLVANPEKINQIDVAAMVVVEFNKHAFKASAKIVKARYGAEHINDFKDLKTSAMAFYNANAGFGKDTRNSSMDGYKRTLDRVEDLYALIHF